MGRLTFLAAMLVVTAVHAKPVTIAVGAPHTPQMVYGPADMLCDLDTCRLFNLPPESGLAPDAIVEFGLPKLDGQDRVDLRRCFKVCRASVVGSVTTQKTPPEHGNPTVAITPIEMRLE